MPRLCCLRDLPSIETGAEPIFRGPRAECGYFDLRQSPAVFPRANFATARNWVLLGRPLTLLSAAVCAMLALAACGGGGSPPVVFDSSPSAISTTAGGPTDSSSTASTESIITPTDAALPQLGPWVDATANLAGMASECGNMYYVGASPTQDLVIAGVALQGLWANDAATGQWARLGTAGAQIMNRTASIVFDPDVPNRLWESGHYSGAGAFRSTDGGKTFQALGAITHLDALSVDLSDPQRRTLLAGSHERADLYRSTDGGATWTNLASRLPAGIGFVSQPLVLDAKRHLVGTSNADGSGIFLSTDGGSTWQQVAKQGVAGLPLVARDRSIYWPVKGGGLVRSTDDGATWTLVTGGGVLASYDLVELPDGRLVSAGATHLIISDDQGVTWRALGPEFPTKGAYGVAYSDARHAVFIWQWDCGNKVQPGSVQRLDVSPLTG